MSWCQSTKSEETNGNDRNLSTDSPDASAGSASRREAFFDVQDLLGIRRGVSESYWKVRGAGDDCP